MDRPANPDHPEAPAPAPVTLPSGRKLLVSLSGTDRTSWALGALALASSVFGLGVAVGKRLRPPAGRAREPR